MAEKNFQMPRLEGIWHLWHFFKWHENGLLR